MYAHICTLLGNIYAYTQEVAEADEILDEIKPISLPQSQEILQCQADILRVYTYSLTRTFQGNVGAQSLVAKIAEKLQR